MGSRIVFDVPEKVDGLAEVVAEYGGQIEFDSPADVVEAERLLSQRAGERGLSIEFDDPVDPMDTPLDPVSRIAKQLDEQGKRYILMCDAFVEQSRGLRVLGRVVLNDGAGPRQWNIPWEYGEPGLDVPTLVACGLSDEEACAIISDWADARAPVLNSAASRWAK